MNKKTRTSRAKINTYNTNINIVIPQWSEARSSEEEYIGMRKCKRKSNVEIKNEEVKRKIGKEEDMKIIKYSRKSHVETLNGEMKGSSSEEEDIGICKCRRINQVGFLIKK